MTPNHAWTCCDTDGNGHFQSVDQLYDGGVWIGYLAEDSRSTQYRQLPSFRELEDNYKRMSLPAPKPLPNSFCGDREAVCRGCVGNGSTILPLQQIRFGLHEGADDAGLFCIMLPQPIDMSIKALEMLRPYEHAFERDATKPFANGFMLLAIRNRVDQSGVLHMVRMTLSSTELSRSAIRPGRQQPDSEPSNESTLMPTVKKTQRGRPQKVVKRKKQLAVGNDLKSLSTVGIRVDSLLGSESGCCLPGRIALLDSSVELNVMRTMCSTPLWSTLLRGA